MFFFRKLIFYNSAHLYKRETKSVKCRGVYLNRRKWIVIRQNNVYYFLIIRKKLFGQRKCVFEQFLASRFLLLQISFLIQKEKNEAYAIRALYLCWLLWYFSWKLCFMKNFPLICTNVALVVFGIIYKTIIIYY